jgi:hypothetical protein
MDKEVINGILEWVNRMNLAHGNTIKDKDGNEYDWGQALCRECYGEDWSNYMVENNIRYPEQKELDRAIKWENGEIPEWAVYDIDTYNTVVEYGLKNED